MGAATRARENERTRKLAAARHPSDHAYANLKCRCEQCVTAWNGKMRARVRAVQRLITAHRDEFDRYYDEERDRVFAAICLADEESV